MHDQSELLLVRVQLGSGTVLNDLEDQLDNRHFHIVFICLIFFFNAQNSSNCGIRNLHYKFKCTKRINYNTTEVK